MNLDRLLEGSEGFVQEVFATWAKVAGTARIDEGIMARFTRKEADDFRGNEDVNITIVIGRE